MNICVEGTRYIGLVTGATFADLGKGVACVDNDGAKVDLFLAGTLPIDEPGLEEMVTRNTADGGLTVTTKLAITVGTPPTEGGETDRSPVEGVTAEIGGAMDRWEPERMRRLGFEYDSIGREPVQPA